MKKLTLIFAIGLIMSLTSCYSYTSIVGSGPAGSEQVKKSNTYFIGGLIPGNQSDAKAMAGGAQNYSVNVTHTFVNMLLGMITFGIYSPTTTTVTK